MFKKKTPGDVQVPDSPQDHGRPQDQCGPQDHNSGDTAKSKDLQFYLTARREWLERYGDYIASAKNWRMAAFGAIGIAALFGAGMVYEADRVHVVPYVVEVNHLGDAVHLAQAVQAGTYNMPVIRHVVANWVHKVRERIPAVAAEKQIYQSTYSIVDGQEAERLTAYYQQHNPYSAYVKNNGGRTVEIVSVLPEGQVTAKGGTQQVQWRETQYNDSGQVKWKKNYEGMVTYTIEPVSNNPRVLREDPFGIVIQSFVYNQVTQ
ncbi:type IV secretion system protein [Acidithiobacillus thiooxidans]|uniref:Conjugal transfer protein n=2 Tax=Acidithiobacillus TaxID=119977 RepID=A0A5P9XS19_ACITH|nr:MULTISPECIES: type IV secretion system protein [Acidithiobacillus]MBU2761093.1 type IV secretion system protein [Acidithiobacillus sulfurivorans]MBU2837017.1 type IV secretion system protein [Acidithiobacillus thiooxidans]QFX96642.1 conjugal transfer protein [Acidithiobacillus thiooxidans ATCC 19377]